MNNPEWYSAKTVCKHQTSRDGAPTKLFEERVILLQAVDFDDAIAKGEAEAHEYCRNLDGVTYIGYVIVYRLFESVVGHGTEVFSLMRESELSNSDYLDHFYDDGKERTQMAE
jgi:hypothetical protein